MDIRITPQLAEAIGKKKFVAFGIDEHSWGWKAQATINIARLESRKIDSLRELLDANKTIRGAGIAIKDIDLYRKAISDHETVRPRTVKQFEMLLRRYLLAVPGHRVYRRSEDFTDTFLAYYVSNVEYHPEMERNGYHSPAYADMDIVYEEFGGMKEKTVKYYEENCRSMTVVEALARAGYYAETPELRAKYLKDVATFSDVIKRVGTQYLATGTAKDDLDGNPKGRNNSWYWRGTHIIQMEREGSPTRVVVDIFYEDDDTARDDHRINLHTWFWDSAVEGPVDEDDEDEDELPAAADSTEPPVIEVPIHPLVAVFDLSKHLRLRIHINFLSEYKYDKQLADKLILPSEMKDLVRMLIEHKEGFFQDIVQGKSGGAVVLLTGAPGVGKTLTAEVYAESEGRALYSVQCSQLGTAPDELEDELLKVFARARRWNAVMLLDEADVYVRERGSDLQQNAIVGVFLRVLEYQSSVLFLTTNRPDDVDDAIASRCIARLHYKIPDGASQRKLWRVLSEGAGIKIADETIAKVENKNPGLTGRDVKNLLKLSKLVIESMGQKEVRPETVEFVKKFKPTASKFNVDDLKK